MAQNRTPEIDKLYQDIVSYRDSEKFMELLQFVKKFSHIAPYNAMLIHTQKPGSSYVATAREWMDRWGRTIKPGARPLIILQPFGPVAFVYEYNDTDGKPLPDSVIAPFRSKSIISKSMLDRLIDNIKADGVEIDFNNYGTDYAGMIQCNDRAKILKKSLPSGSCSIRSYYTIVVNDNLSDTSKYTTILHELAHLYCGHLYHDHKVIKWLPERWGLSPGQMEFEAETVCWLVCERLGIDNPSAEYLSGYLQENGEIPLVSVDAIMKATGTIESFTVGIKQPRKELLISKDN